MVEIGRTATVFPPAGFLGEPAGALQLPQGALDGGAGQAQFSGHGGHGGPADALLVGSLSQVHIDRHCPMGQIGGIDGVKIAHSQPSSTYSFGSSLPRPHCLEPTCEGFSASMGGAS